MDLLTSLVMIIQFERLGMMNKPRRKELAFRKTQHKILRCKDLKPPERIILAIIVEAVDWYTLKLPRCRSAIRNESQLSKSTVDRVLLKFEEMMILKVTRSKKDNGHYHTSKYELRLVGLAQILKVTPSKLMMYTSKGSSQIETGGCINLRQGVVSNRDEGVVSNRDEGLYQVDDINPVKIPVKINPVKNPVLNVDTNEGQNSNPTSHPLKEAKKEEAKKEEGYNPWKSGQRKVDFAKARRNVLKKNNWGEWV